MDGKKVRFVIFSCGFNCSEYVQSNMTSIMGQTYDNYVHIIVDDASEDRTPDKINRLRHDKTFIYRNRVNQKWIPNALQYLDKHIQSDEDVILTVDLDDYLSHRNVLFNLNEIYNGSDVWMTYSDFKYLKSGRLSSWIPEYTQNIINRKLFRESIWSFTHLRTMKAFLWKNINKNDLKDNNGNYFKYAYDQAVFLPCLEMANLNHIKHVQEVQYIYNDMSPLQVEKINRKEQEDNARYIRSKMKYKSMIRNNNE